MNETKFCTYPNCQNTGFCCNGVCKKAKTLTDEEIHKAEYEFMYWNRSLKEPLVKLASELYVFEQAVAILRKAQDK
jgi:hypothetical protein